MLSTICLSLKPVTRLPRILRGAARPEIQGTAPPDGFNDSVGRVPHGVTAHIILLNYPVQMQGWTIAPAVAMGNATVLNPSEDACLSIVCVAELVVKAGFPAGAFDPVTGYCHEACAAPMAHPTSTPPRSPVRPKLAST
ncbi:MAG TPA: aldehyde dehydrogenase family protein [Candidatus Sulfotelmatobacter sp.]|nr:aldehyde dehydrogenase family protein [Candidatus Sulfotelmatobacter sp.]